MQIQSTNLYFNNFNYFKIFNLNTNQKLEKVLNHCIMISTPKIFLNLLKENKISIDCIEGIVLEELDYCISFGYENDVSQICQIFKDKNIYKLITCSSGSEEILNLKKTLMN